MSEDLGNAISSAKLRRRRYLAHTLLVAAILLCGGLLAYPPDNLPFYPQCPIHQYFGIFCPGCGATRALAALLHGRFVDALRLNAFFVLLLPALAGGGLRCYRRALRPGIYRWPNPPAPALYATLVATAIFTVVRNLP